MRVTGRGGFIRGQDHHGAQLLVPLHKEKKSHINDRNEKCKGTALGRMNRQQIHSNAPPKNRITIERHVIRMGHKGSWPFFQLTNRVLSACLPFINAASTPLTAACSTIVWQTSVTWVATVQAKAPTSRPAGGEGGLGLHLGHLGGLGEGHSSSVQHRASTLAASQHAYHGAEKNGKEKAPSLTPPTRPIPGECSQITPPPLSKLRKSPKLMQSLSLL